MKIGLLTSSRADYGIYFPLIVKLKECSEINLEIIAFGTHLSEKHGNTAQEILNDGFSVNHQIEHCISLDDSPKAISDAIARTISSFSEFWQDHSYDLVFALGDRYEMFAAVTAGLPFQVKFAHLYGGETTLGAIDNSFRHSISHMSTIHFVSCEDYKNRLSELIGSDESIYNVGSLSVDNINKMNFLSVQEFKQQFNIDLSIPTVLCTLHSETINFEQTRTQVETFCSALLKLKGKQILITMPNSDTSNQIIRSVFEDFAVKNKNILLRESLGRKGYLSAMKYAEFIIGNSSSGFVEAAAMNKLVVNIGIRQKGRILTSNIISCSFDREEILNSIHVIENKKTENFKNSFYGDGNSSTKIISTILEMDLLQV
jgi:GDP/UDP-N,N'-diacetylbacillosamine 2-epimerase (hydrolysing)